MLGRGGRGDRGKPVGFLRGEVWEKVWGVEMACSLGLIFLIISGPARGSSGIWSAVSSRLMAGSISCWIIL